MTKLLIILGILAAIIILAIAVGCAIYSLSGGDNDNMMTEEHTYGQDIEKDGIRWGDGWW